MLSLASSLACASIDVNPFASGNWYVNPAYQRELDTSIKNATGVAQANLKLMRDVSCLCAHEP